MKLIIDIPEELYKGIECRNPELETEYVCYELMKAVDNGTSLPKGHGRLIDADELKKHKYHDNDRFENAVAVAQIDWADAIIEADETDMRGE